jgi:hypothetical protein
MVKHRIGLVFPVLLLLALAACGKNYYPSKPPPPFSAESFHSGCKEETSRTGKISGNGSIILSSFNDTIRVVHANAHYNCCADVKMEVEKTDYGFDLCEKDEGFNCGCTCDSDITTFIYGLAGGTYLVKVFDLDGNHIDQGYVVVRPKDPTGPNG